MVTGFYRDMALGGPYFSMFLLYVMFAHAGRHIRLSDPRFPDFGQGEGFLLKAKQLLVELLDTPRITTAQGLLIMGGRQSAVGKTSEGWMYTSMGIAMIKDHGLHIRKDTGALLRNLESDDLEARKRLYLSAYVWDKSLSLCIGRRPSLPDMPYSRDCLLDDVDNQEHWSPEYIGDSSETYPQPTYSHNTDNFMSFVKLAQIINQVYAAIYGNQAALSPSIIYDLEKKLRNYYTALPRHLKVDSPHNDNAVAPPPHIATVNILYHTVLILLFRPFYNQTPQSTAPVYRALTNYAHKVCRAEAEIVNASFKVYGRTFNFQNQTHLLSYCVYTAATIDVQGMQSTDPVEARQATERLEVMLRMLDTEAEQLPGVRRSVDIIRGQIAQIGKKDEGHEKRFGALPAVDGPQVQQMCSPTSVQTGHSNTAVDAMPPPPQQVRQASSATPSWPGVQLQFPDQGPWQQPFDPMFDPTLTDGFPVDGGDMSWFNWDELDISGGFGMFGYDGW